MAARFIPLDIYLLLILQRKCFLRPFSLSERRTINEKLSTMTLRNIVTDEFLELATISPFRTPNTVTFTTEDLELKGRFKTVKLPSNIPIDLTTYYLLHYSFETKCAFEPTVLCNNFHYPMDAIEIGID